ncbi:SEC-C metal-binding domain-containing protein [Alkalisalibacterium limincola]|nr:SEC-C metal-binding domain-containing protein [Alkalisalibacterium limincola]
MNDFPDHDNRSVAVPDTLHVFISLIVSSVIRGVPPAQLYDLGERMVPDMLPAMARQPGSGDGVRIMARMLVRSITEHTPRPDRRFAMQAAARPGRNEPCDCGSGRKFKQCCLVWEQGAPESPVAGMNLLPYVLECLPRTQWGELVGSAIDPRAVDDAARGMLEAGQGQLAVALLEPWFKGASEIPGKHEPLLDTLVDAFTELGRPRKKKQLVAHALAHGDHVIRSSMHQRLASIAADDGDYAAAWQHFRQAQREHADAASLAHLEIILLTNQGEHARARERARFWIARLQRIDAVGNAELIDFLRDVADRGQQALFDIQAQQRPELRALQELLDAAPAPVSCYGFIGGRGGDLGALRPDRALSAALQAWAQVFPQVGPSLTALGVEDHPALDDPAPWLQCLAARPLLWQSIEVLDDLVLALTGDWMSGMETLCDGLLDRAETLLHLTLDEHPGKTLEWAHMENRPALRLLAHRIALGDPHADDAVLDRMQWMLALNPSDNHGNRDLLCAGLLVRGDATRALAIGDQFPDDANLAFARVLALYALERRDEAQQALREAHAGLPRIAPMLAAANPRRPALKPGWSTYGGADQAWYHRQRYLPAWERFEGALPWLRKALRAIKRGRA